MSATVARVANGSRGVTVIQQSIVDREIAALELGPKLGSIKELRGTAGVPLLGKSLYR
jgi:hypothetical protein